MAGIVAEPLDPHDGFNWIFLVELLICGILTIFFLFYFNRLFATLVAYAIRAYTWRAFNAYIDITALQVSLLGGRLFFKDIRYHGHNETILVHGGYITWNYWLRRVKDAGVYTDDGSAPGSDSASHSSSTSRTRSGSTSGNVDKAEKGGKQTRKELPCRFSIKVSGIEAFLYNRSPAYDGIIEAVQRKAESDAAQQKTPEGSVSGSELPEKKEHHHHNKLKKSHTQAEKKVPRQDTSRSTVSGPTKADLPAFLRLLPVHVDIVKGAIVVGNEHTLAVITAQFEKATGTLDASTSGPLDVYQQLFNFQITHPVVHMKPNPDYKIGQLDSAVQFKQEVAEGSSAGSIIEKEARHRMHWRWLTRIPSPFRFFSKDNDSIHTHTKNNSGNRNPPLNAQWTFPGRERWKGLARYLDDTTNDGHGEWDGIEYAKTSLIADCPCVNISFYWDVPGPVPNDMDQSKYVDPARPYDMNGCAPPDYGMDIQVFGGIIQYGPWADRHRGVFQSIFFPASRVDAVPSTPLKPGDLRVLSVFKLYLSIEEDTTLRIPIRESSKDWKWKGKAHTLAAHDKLGENKSKAKSRIRRGKRRDATGSQNVRPFAWIDVKIAEKSTVNYVMDMYASEHGYQSKVDVDVPSTEISSSVNHGLLWRSGALAIDCDLSNPLGWNTLRKWLFNIKCQDLELFLLRDHMFLIMDLVADWGTGPPPDYFLFVPFQYLLNVDFSNFKIYLNTNDSNIINNPADLEDNNFVILSGKGLQGDVFIPLDTFRPLQNEIKFDVKGQNLGLEILMPPKNTLQTFVQSPNVAHLGGLTLSGSHTFMAETSPMNTDRLYMDIQGHKLNLELYGWLIHHFMKIKDNYFGDDMHFKTLEEFQGLPAANITAEGASPNGDASSISNDLDVILCVSADDVCVLLPANLYSAERGIRADLPYASADLRFTNYYMDLMVNFSPISISLGGLLADADVPKEFSSGRTELFVDSTVIYGHRLFGLPPLEPTYLCSWDFDVGRITGDCTSEFLEAAAGAARSFAFTLDDDENTLPLTEIPIIHDTTFLRLKTHDIGICIHISKEALVLKTRPVSLNFNDLAGATFSERLHVLVPDLTVIAVPSEAASHHRQKSMNDVVFDDVAAKRFDESFTHTSILISAQPGIRAYCTPEFVTCVAELIELLQPRRPEDLLDDFQLSVMTKILQNRNRLEGKGSSLEFNIRIPFTHVRFQHSFQSHSVQETGQDQYDVVLNRLGLTARLKKFPGERAGEDTIALHSTLGSLGLSVAERASETATRSVAIQAEMRDVLFWMFQGNRTSINVSFRTFENAMASKKVDYLAALIHRTALMAETLIHQFAEIEQRYQQRLRYLTWRLSCVQDQYADPAFLTKASYALRATRDHLRSHDSWKIISRFRYTWQCLSQAEKDTVLSDCSRPDVTSPEDAEQQIIAMLDQWRTWDLAHVKKSFAIKFLFGYTENKLPTPESAPLYVDIKSAEIKLTVDPGPRQSEVSLGLLAINVALLPPTQPNGLMLVDSEDVPRRTTIVQISSRKTAFHIRWEICELAESLLKLFQKENIKAIEQAKSTPANKLSGPAPTSDHDLQVVFATDKFQITLDTFNLKSINTAQNLRFSFLDADSRASKLGEILSAHLHVDLAVSELISRSRLVAKTQFERPSIDFAMTEQSSTNRLPNEIKVAATSHRITVKVQDDVLGLIELVDRVLKDEVAYFHRQSAALQEITKADQKLEMPKEDASQLPNISLALFMDSYQIELAILQPCGWSITGSSGRIAVIPALGKRITLQVDYDLEASLHRLYSISKQGSHVISSVELPPLNGRLTIKQNETQTRIAASGIVEKVHVQASEIQSLISTINKPELAQMFKAVQDDIGVLKTHIGEMFPASAKSPVPQPTTSSRDTLFTVKMTFHGMNVAASAPGQGKDSPTANLAFRLSTVQLNATNIDADQSIMLYPEAVVRIHEVTVDLSLKDPDSVRRCGNLTFSAVFQATTEQESEPTRRVYCLRSSGLEVNAFADTASAVVDVVNHLQDRIKDLDLSKEKRYLRRLRHTKSRISQRRDRSLKQHIEQDAESDSSGALFTSTYSLELLDLQVSWIVGNSVAPFPQNEIQDLVLSFGRIDLSTQKDDAARLMIEDMRLQMVPVSANKKNRSLNSALLPKMVFNVAYASTKDTRKLAFFAAGKSLDLQLDSHFILPGNIIEQSISLAGKKFREASANWSMTPTTTGAKRKNPFGNKRLASLTADVNFAGAVVHVHGSDATPAQGSSGRAQQKGRYSQFVGDESKSSMALRAPGVAVRIEYMDDGSDPSLNAELRVDGSTNTLLPTVVPIIIDISDSIKAVVREKDDKGTSDLPEQPEQPQGQSKPAAKLLEDENIITADPATLLGRTRLNLGLRICKQEFSLSCQPIARVAAVAKVEDIYITVNSVKSQEHGHFFAASAMFEKLQTTVQHVYSRESTFSLDMESIVLSLVNSKHLSGTSGISAILKINPTALQINARQLQDFLLFREIWIPPEIRRASKPTPENTNSEPQEYLIQRYQQVATATAFPWNANIAIADVKVDLDLGQSIGKSWLHIHNLWASSKKTTTAEQNLCVGIEKIGVESTGRTSGFIELHDIKVRTSIGWPLQDPGTRQAPLIQASVAFRQLRVKTGFDFQAFLMADIADFGFMMYNVRPEGEDVQDRLVAILDGGKVHVFCHATSAAQGLALWQAVERLIQDNQQAYKQSLKDIEKFLRRKSSIAEPFDRSPSQSQILPKSDKDSFKAPISLHTDVVLTLRSIRLGVFPSTFIDNQVLMLEAGDMQARFAVALEKKNKIHSSLGMTLGQLSVALSSVPTPKKSKPVTELDVEDVSTSVSSARGGTILRVPKVIATMHTWQVPKSTHIDYLFRSSLEGKVDVGWNYSRISYIRTMWSNHSRTLASRLGKPLPESNIKISTSQTLQDASDNPGSGASTADKTAIPSGRPRATSTSSENQEKITAVVNVPQSKYEYTPLEPPLIETPQLRDMGEATPPLEWIGLHRDRLPNVTHQIVIVTLLEVAREVEEAYERILGSS
ncbi:hypothetical protein COCC4DRAFT_175824 [Bipolaris maydis ATCC 48331]|uniref:Fermentation associated protein n=1 Tax=Cochliobolus heterostrophus (strain C4 / ATCC 48331 / race T) TaxID=665024 RepID=N4WRJ3_COCH4|nr:uncharacterized protein COCC4DRAFT_175824 [Bipolaris maydis ATCC 48331]ENI02010.1 hypothetical protein COCC4DRAFT_175824 [Bipolaris maydis ATCC 48331]